MANAAKLTAELFRIPISDERAGNLFRVAVICAFNEKAHASSGAIEITVFIPVLPADLSEIAPFYLAVLFFNAHFSTIASPMLQTRAAVCDSIKPNFSSLEGM
jgi:hypothetical protein